MKIENSLEKYYEKLLNTEFAWDRNSLSQTDTVIGGLCLKYKDKVRESVSKIKNGKAAGPPGVVSKMFF